MWVRSIRNNFKSCCRRKTGEHEPPDEEERRRDERAQRAAFSMYKATEHTASLVYTQRVDTPDESKNSRGGRSLEISVANVVDHHGRFIEQERVDRDRRHDRVCNEAKARLL
jgi:acyl-CoA synthetase (AMP-forming)/AMP-acid ligase II